MAYLNALRFADTPSLDAFGRQRVSDPLTLFDSKQLHDAQPLFWDDQAVSGSGTGSSHSTNRASTTLSVSGTTAGNRTRQTFQRFNYQPGKSQLVLMTFVMDASGGGTGITRRAGIYDDENGIFLEDAEGAYRIVRRSYATGSAVDTAVSQASWNVDPMNGTGVSGITLDFTKTQILAVDYEWLGVGRVRVGFVVDGKVYIAHEFLNANTLDVVYMSTPNLPLRYELENDGTGAASTLETICASVVSEGGQQATGIRHAVTSGAIAYVTAATTYAAMSLRLKTTHLDSSVDFLSESFLCSSVNDQAEWGLVLNPTIAGTLSYTGVTNSAIEYAVGAAANTLTGGTLLQAGYFTSDSSAEISSEFIRLGAAIDGTRDVLTLCITPITTNMTIYVAANWRESA